MTSPLTIEVPCCYAEEWKCKLEEMHLGPKKHKRDEMEQHEPGDAAGGQIISGSVNCGIIHVRMLYGVCQMEKGVKGSGVSYTTLFLDYVLRVTTVIYLCLTCKLSISLQRNTSSYQGGSRNIFNMQRVGSTLQLKSLTHNL